jgi:hypothetical protein
MTIILKSCIHKQGIHWEGESMTVINSKEIANTRIGKVEECLVVSSISEKDLNKQNGHSWVNSLVENPSKIQPNIKCRS